MELHQTSQLPLSLRSARKSDMRAQFGALCWRMKEGKLQFLLITSRERGRWIIPKGWPMDGTTPAEAALTEAFEEAGVVGKVTDHCVGVYSYPKRLKPKQVVNCLVMVYPVKVKRLLKRYPEMKMRKRKWLGRKKAMERVDDRPMAHVIEHFDPALL